MNAEAFKLARETLRLAVKEYGWRRIPWTYATYPELDNRKQYRYGPGKFEGQPWSIVHFYDAYMNGDAGDYVSDALSVYELTETERAAFGLTEPYVGLFFSGQGFVSLGELSLAEYRAACECAEADEGNA